MLRAFIAVASLLCFGCFLQPVLAQPGLLDQSFVPPDLTFGGANEGSVSRVVVQPDGRIVWLGSFSAIAAVQRPGLVRLFADGTADFSFDPGTGAGTPSSFNPAVGGNSALSDMALQPDGKLLVVGSFTNFNGLIRRGAVRLNSDGSVDESFDPGAGANAPLSAAAVLNDGSILVGGAFTSFGGMPRTNLVRLSPNGSLDTAFTTSIAQPVTSMTRQTDGKILCAAGRIQAARSSAKVLRLFADGSLDPSFTNGAGPNEVVFYAQPAPAGKVVIVGYFSSVNGTNRYRIARLNEDGGLDLSFDPAPAGFTLGANATAESVAVQPDGKIVLGGSFGGFSTYTRRNIMRLNTDGSIDSSFGYEPLSGADSTVKLVTLQNDGNVLISGLFNTVNGVTFIDDSLATTPQAAIAACKAFPNQPLTLLVGGLDRGVDYTPLVTYLKAHPGDLTTGSNGRGSAGHLAGALFKAMAGVDIRYVPYRTTPQAQSDLIGGRLSMMWLSTLTDYIKAGTLRPIAVTSLERWKLFPDVPTFDELGLKGYEATTWISMHMPKAAPKEAINTITSALDAALADPAVRERLDQVGVLAPRVTGPDFLAKYLKAEVDKWAEILRANKDGD